MAVEGLRQAFTGCGSEALSGLRNQQVGLAGLHAFLAPLFAQAGASAFVAAPCRIPLCSPSPRRWGVAGQRVPIFDSTSPTRRASPRVCAIVCVWYSGGVMPLRLHVKWPSVGQVEADITQRMANRVLASGASGNNWLGRWGDTIHVHAFAPNNVVPDVDRYRLARDAPHDDQRVCSLNGWFLVRHPPSCFQWSPWRDRFAVPALGHFNATVVVLLESPHKDEYGSQNLARPIAPAVGTTGRKVREVLLAMLLDYAGEFLRADTRVIIANPVPFQASLHWVYDRRANTPYGRKKIRDEVWKALWSFGPIREDFDVRMAMYRPDITINACTASLRPMVSDAILATGLGVLFETEHPSVPGAWTANNHTMWQRAAEHA